MTEFVGLLVGVLVGENSRPDNDWSHDCKNLARICQFWQVFSMLESPGESEPFHHLGGLE